MGAVTPGLGSVDKLIPALTPPVPGEGGSNNDTDETPGDAGIVEEVGDAEGTVVGPFSA